MKRFIAVIIISAMLLVTVTSCARRVQVTTNPQGGTSYVIDDRLKDILESDLPADAKERAVKDLLAAEQRKGAGWQDWVIRFITAGFAAWAAYEASRASRKVDDVAKP